MKGFGQKNQSKKKRNLNEEKKFKNTQLVKKAFNLQAQGKKFEAAKYYAYLIQEGLRDYRVFSNYGTFLKETGNYKQAEIELNKAISLNPRYSNAHYNLAGLLIDIGNLQKAEIHLREAISLNPDFAIAHYNLGFILKDLGNIEEAEFYTQNAININPEFTDAYFSLSTMQNQNKNQKWHDKLFSEGLLKNKDNREILNILFARSNILHKKNKFKDSAENLIAANNLKLKIHKSEANLLIDKTRKLKISSDKYKKNYQELENKEICIFIVGLPRCGSTLVESIISLNSQVTDLGEVNIFEEAYREYLQSDHNLNLSEIYIKKARILKPKGKITTNKWLFNYQYAGIIAKAIPNAKIIHCFRNPLDNILSIYRSHFRTGNTFSSSLSDCAEVYSDQEDIMENYKKEFRKKIYDLNYDELVTNPLEEIKSLILWLGWDWNKSYLSPHLNIRKVLTRSNVQVRSPINSKSVGGWKNYKNMLKPSIQILIKNNKYRE